jgi:hypothetical protein
MNRSVLVALGALVLTSLTVSSLAHAESSEEPSAEPNGAGISTDVMKLMPLDLTAFGDIRYRFTHPGLDQFEIGSVELDSALQLSPHVLVSAAFAYVPDEDKVALGAFTVDGSLFGPEKKHLFKTELVQDSGLVFGKFDVPFGLAYLEYPATENRFVDLPHVVMASHGGWNDIGGQAYVIADHFDLTLYLVNAHALENDEPVAAGRHAQHAYGGRLGIKPIESISVGGSIAEVTGDLETGMWGADVSAAAGPFVLKNEFIRRTPVEGPTVQGAYTQAFAKVGAFFGGVRYETTLNDAAIVDTAGALTAGVEVFPQAEIRVAHLRSFESDLQTTYLQLVGGSIWQPTGLRR